jgi:hypothetical protein
MKHKPISLFIKEDKSMNELKELLKDMDIPQMRLEKMDLHWMQRNLAIRNSAHPNFEKAMKLIVRELRRNYTK